MLMKIENISEGQIFKNYKALCNELGVPVEAGNSKKAQLKDWECYFAYVKQGNKFIITEIYDVKKEKTDGRGKSEGSRNNNSIYGDYVQLLIADLLVRQEKKHISISRTSLLNTVNMINENYGKCSRRVKDLASVYKIAPYVIYDFYNTSNSSFKSSIETALKNLHSKRLLWYKDVIKVCKSNDVHEEATLAELDMINHYELLALKDTPFKTIEEVPMTKHWKPFREKVIKHLKQNTEIKYYYKAYFISVELDFLEQERDELMQFILEDDNRRKLKSELNDIVQSHLYGNAGKRHDNSIYSTSKMAEVRYDLEYTNKINQLIKLLIDDEQEDIVESLNLYSNNKIEDVEELFAG
jgi:hypothetical protein